jgi:hypothetical protein
MIAKAWCQLVVLGAPTVARDLASVVSIGPRGSAPGVREAAPGARCAST